MEISTKFAQCHLTRFVFSSSYLMGIAILQTVLETK